MATALIFFAFCPTSRSQTLAYSNLVSRLTDLEYLSTVPSPGDSCALWSSYDRSSYYDPGTGQYVNWAANNDCCGIIRTEGTNQVLAEMTGPGCLWRIWSATPSSGHVRIYLDDTNAPPVIDLPFSAYFDGAHAPFTNSALVHTTAANGWNNYTPIPYQKSCKIVADPGWGSYYQFTYETFPTSTVVPTFNPQLSASDAVALAQANQILSHPGADPAGVRPGQTTLTNLVSVSAGSTQLVAQVSGAGAITALRVQLNLPPSPDDFDLLRSLALQIKWDGETNPSVWAPLGDFFGTAPGGNLYTSLPLGHTADGWWYCYWYMPFGDGARIELVNDGSTAQQVNFQISTAPLSRPLAQLTRFHAKWHRDDFLLTDPNRAIDWPILTTTGTGRFVGTMLHVWNPQGGWWGEGDDKFFVDGESFPSSFGTGSEDYFGYAWSSPVLFQHALHNQTHNDGNNKGHLSVNRWHIADAVPFQQSFLGCIEKYFSNSRPTLYAGMAYWYLAPGGQDPYLPVPLTNRVDYWTPLVVYLVPGAIEGEALPILGQTAGTAQPQDMSSFSGQWSRNAQLWWHGAQPGDTLDLGLPVTNAGTYKLTVALTKALDYGIVQLYLDGQALGSPIDLYNSSVVPTGPLLLGTFSLSAGQHTLRAQIVGANPNATLSYMFGLDYVKLEPPIALLDALSLGNPGGDLAVVYTAPVEPASATNVANYALNNGATVNAARMGATADTVLLQVSGLTPGSSNLLTASNVRDTASPPNTLPAASSRLIDQNLHSWYRLDETGGTTAGDASGNGRNGSLANGAAPGYTGKVLRAVKFDGQAGQVTLPASGYDNFTQGLTVALWANPASATTSWARFLDLGNGPGSDNILLARNATSADLTFEVYAGNSSGGKVTAPGALALNQWQHLVATMDASGQVILYKNGLPLMTNLTAVPNVLARTRNFLGRSNWSQDGFFQGKMDDVRLYNRVLSPAAVLALANGGGPDDADPSVATVSLAVTVPTTALTNSPPGAFTVTRTGPTDAALSVQYRLAGTATNGVDYVALSGSAVIQAGASQAQILISALDHAFTNLFRTVSLTLTGAAGYALSDEDSGTVTIQNNEIPPTPVLATADNARSSTNGTTVEVWFAQPVVLPSATNRANYKLINAPGLTITNATLNPTRNLQVVLGLSGPLPANAQISVAGVQDSNGNSASNQLSILPRLDLATNVVANQYQQGRPAALSRSTDGVVQHDANVTTWTTFGGATGLSDFVGLTYSQLQVFGALKVDLGYQFVDGGDWSLPPQVYILKRPVDTNQRAPETDPADWAPVPASLVSGSVFSSAPDAPTGTPPTNSPVVFDLSALPNSARAGYGWAVGGVPGNGPSAQFVSVAELRGFGSSASALSGPPQVLLDVQPASVTQPAGLPLVLSVAAAGSSPLAYQWQCRGTNLLDDGRILGAQSNVLVVAHTCWSDAGSYRLLITNAVGATASSAATLTLTRPAFNNGDGWARNGNAALSNGLLTLTDGATGEASSSFLAAPQYIGAFRASWTYQDLGGGGADGMAFVLQNDPRGASALGGSGGGLGCSGLTPSAALQFNIYANNTVGLAFQTNGQAGAPYASTAPVNLAGGNPIAVRVQYDGLTLSVTLTDLTSAATFRTNFICNLPALLGADSAYVGFTGADGAIASHQQVSQFSFASLPRLSAQPTAAHVTFSWPASASGFVLQQTASLAASPWLNLTNALALQGDRWQMSVPITPAPQFYRLTLP